MFRRQSKRALLIRRLMVYALMVLSVIALVGTILLFILGYRLDSTNRLERGALVQFESSPSGSAVTIDGAHLNGLTPTKTTALAGMHDITISRKGYEMWQKSVNFVAGTLTWIDYPILVPVNRPVQTVRSYDSLVDSAASANRRYMLLQLKQSEPVFQLVNLDSNDASTSSVQLPQTAYTQPTTTSPQSFSIDRWDADGRYVILQHMYDNKKEWIVMDTRQPNRSRNVTDLLDIAIEQLRFSGSSGNIFFARLSDGTIRKLDTGAQTISRALVTSATDFSVFESNIITYTANTSTAATKAYSVGIYKDGETAAVDLSSATSDAGLKIATTRYVNDDYIAVSSGKTITIYRGDYPRSAADVTDMTTYATLTFSDTVKNLTFSREGTYLIAQAGKKYMSFDLESRTSYSSMIDTTEKTIAPLSWIAPGYLFSDYGGSLQLREFDGANQHTINPVASGFDVTFTSNERYLYSIGKADNGSYNLQRVKMVIN